jgi:hypothetical protein
VSTDAAGAAAPYRIRYTPTGAEVRLSGVVTAAIIAAARREVARQHYPGGRRFLLIDHSAAEGWAIAGHEFPELVDAVDEYHAAGPRLLMAIAVPQLEGYAATRTWEVFAEALPVETGVHRTRDAALTWLASRGVDIAELGQAGASD